MEAKIVEVEAFTVHGLARRVGYHEAHTECMKIWEEFVPQMQANAPPSGVSYGCCIDAKEPDEDYPQGSFIYMAAVDTREKFEGDGFSDLPVEGGTFAQFTYQGPISGLGDFMRGIYSGWVTNNGKWELRPCANFERYDERFNPEDGITDIFIPVSPVS